MLEAYNAALEGAFDLFSYCSAVFPKEWQEKLPDIVRKRAIEFALHARRAHEISGVSYKAVSKLSDFRLKLTQADDIDVESSYGETLNMMIHSQFVELRTVIRSESLPKIFLQSPEEMNLVFMVVETDRRARKHLNLYGVATKFLVEAAPKILREIRP